jgi:rubrerythrin
MTIEESIETAIRMERKVHAAYIAAVSRARDTMAKQVFQTLANEEQGHVAYLEKRLAEWRKDGCLALEKLASILPPIDRLRGRVRELLAEPALGGDAADPDLDELRQALVVEEETSRYYQRMVHELPAEAQTLFLRFLDVEDGHSAVVQAEIDLVSRHGRWFPLSELIPDRG